MNLFFSRENQMRHDPVNRPSHYMMELPDGRELEAIQIIHAKVGNEGMVAHCEATALGYLLRSGNKMENPKSQDFRKAIWFLDYAAKILEKKALKDL